MTIRPAFATTVATAALALATFGLLTFSTSTANAADVVTASPASAPTNDPTCSLEHYVGLPYEDAIAIEEVICSEAKSRNHAGARYRVRVSKLGGQIVVRLILDRAGDTKSLDRQVIVSGIDEIPVAAPRLVTSTIDEKALVETQNVDNVVGGEVRNKKSVKARVNATIGVVGAGMLGADPSAGMSIGISAGDARWSFITDLRLTGDAFEQGVTLPLQVLALGLWKPKLDSASSFGSLGGGVRHHFSTDNTSAFAGMGLGLTHVGYRDRGAELKNTGLGTFAEVGIDVLRASTIGGTVSLRLDAPFFTVQGTREIVDGNTATTDGGSPYPVSPAQSRNTESVTSWTPVASLAFAMRF